MVVTPTYPGVYVREAPSLARAIVGVSTSIAAIVGHTMKGPTDKAVRVRNVGEFERTFGGLSRESEVAYAMHQFFQNGGTDAYVVRVAKDARAAAVTLRDAGGTPVLVAKAVNPGVWGNLVRLRVDHATANPDNEFNLEVTRYEIRQGALQVAEREQFRNLRMNPDSNVHAPRVVTAASKIVQLSTATGLAFGATGFALSSRLDPFPTISAADTTIELLVDGTDSMTLVISGSPPGDIDDLVNAIDGAITSLGLDSRIEVLRTDARGQADAAGEHVMIASLSTGSSSSVQVRSAPSNDLAALIGLGLANGGREKEGASTRRPQQNGTTSADASDLVGTNVSGTIRVNVQDHTDPASPVALVTDEDVTLPPTPYGPALRDALQSLIRGIDHASTQGAVVELNGPTLRVVPSASTPNAVITFGEAGATALRLGAGALANVQEYGLGVGPTFGAQSDRVLGSDGDPPERDDIVGSYAGKKGMYALRDVDIFNLLLIPRTARLGEAEASTVIDAAVTFCEERRAFFILDPDPAKGVNDVAEWAADATTSKNAAVFFPRIKVADPLDGFRLRDMPASGAIAGVFARTDSTRGVWKAPAGIEAGVRGARGLQHPLTDGENGDLNPLGVNCLRTFPDVGTVVWGARTRAGADRLTSEWKYVPVRRMALFIEESLYRGTQWVVFEPNDEPLWAQIRLNVGAFMQGLFRQGAFQGKTPRDAFFVKCDKETTTPDDVQRGIVNVLVGFAPLRPAEFVIITVSQMAGQSQA